LSTPTSEACTIALIAAVRDAALAPASASRASTRSRTRASANRGVFSISIGLSLASRSTHRLLRAKAEIPSPYFLLALRVCRTMLAFKVETMPMPKALDPITRDLWHVVAATDELAIGLVETTLLLDRRIALTRGLDGEPVVWFASDEENGDE